MRKRFARAALPEIQPPEDDAQRVLG